MRKGIISREIASAVVGACMRNLENQGKDRKLNIFAKAKYSLFYISIVLFLKNHLSL